MENNQVLKRLNSFIHEFDELIILSDKLTKEQSEYDKALNELYHRIEGTTITHVCQSHKLIKELKQVLDKRRMNKIEAILVRSTCDGLRDNIEKLKIFHKSQLKSHEKIQTKLLENAKI